MTFSDAGAAAIGTDKKGVHVLLDMTRLGVESGPTSNNPFWQSPHTWTLVQGDGAFGWINLWLMQPQFKTGYFTITYDSNFTAAYLNFVASPLGVNPS